MECFDGLANEERDGFEDEEEVDRLNIESLRIRELNT